MLLAKDSSVSEVVLDAIAEATNMIIGNVKSSLERHLAPLGISKSPAPGVCTVELGLSRSSSRVVS
jgi:hypothetical protein